MPRNQKNSQAREDEAEELESVDAPRVDELDEEERVPQSSRVEQSFEDEEILDDEDAEEIDLDDLAAMEGPDA